jgi:hypothetical protein
VLKRKGDKFALKTFCDCYYASVDEGNIYDNVILSDTPYYWTLLEVMGNNY